MEPELYTSSMEEAAVTLPWALGFYLSVVWKPISEALQLQNICAATHSVCLWETFTHTSYNEKPVVAAFTELQISALG